MSYLDPNLQDNSWLRNEIDKAHAAQPHQARAVIDRRTKQDSQRTTVAIDSELSRLARENERLCRENLALHQELRRMHTYRDLAKVLGGFALFMVVLWVVLE